MKFTEEQHVFMKKYIPGHHHSEIAEEFKKRFEQKITTDQVRSYCRNHKIKTGFSGRFEKGHIPMNKGKKTQTKGRMAETQFKKGQPAINKLPIGTEVVKGDGYVWVKIEEPNKWKQKHRIVWEEKNGPIPEGMLITFLDGDRTNCSLDNLQLITQRTNQIMNRKNLRTESKELTQTGIAIANLIEKTESIKAKKGRRK